MNEHRSDQDLADRVGHELRRRAAAVEPAHLTLEAVRGRARSIRRRRRGAASVAVAAVVAAVLPWGLQLGEVAERPAPAPAPADPTPGPTPGPDGEHALGLFGIPEGEPAAVPYLRYADRTLVTTDGEVPLAQDHHQVLPFGDGHLALASGDSPGPVDVRLYRLDEDHRRAEDLGPVANRIVASPDGSRTAWVEVTTSGATLAVAEDGGEPERTPLEAAYALPIGFVDDGVVVAPDAGSSEGHVVVGPGGTTPLDAFQYAWDSSPDTDVVVGQTDYRAAGDTQCSGAWDTLSRQLLWERCGVVLGDLSPDGTRVLAFDTPSLPDSTGIAVLDALTGEPLVAYAARRGVASVADAVWEDADTALALVEQDGRQALVRLGLDGSQELASESLPTPGMRRELRFVERPVGAVG